MNNGADPIAFIKHLLCSRLFYGPTGKKINYGVYSNKILSLFGNPPHMGCKAELSLELPVRHQKNPSCELSRLSLSI